MITASALLAALAIAIGLSLFVVGEHFSLFWDFRVYTSAIQAMAAGEDPYDPAILHTYNAPEFLYFVSPPAVAAVMQGFAKLGLSGFYAVMIVALHIGAMIATPVMLCRLFFGEGKGRLPLAFSATFAMLSGAGVFALSVVNNSTPLYAFIVLATVIGFRERRWRLFHVAVLLATIFKPYYVVLWIVPVLARKFSWRQVIIGSACGVAGLSTYGLAYVFAPELFASWWEMLQLQILTSGSRGDSLFGFVPRILGESAPEWAAYAVHVAYMAVIVLLLLFSRAQGTARWAALIVAGIFLNPRIMVYDKITAAIPMVYLGALLIPALIPVRASLGLRLAASALAMSFGAAALTMGLHAPSGLLFPTLALALIAGASLLLTHEEEVS